MPRKNELAPPGVEYTINGKEIVGKSGSIFKLVLDSSISGDCDVHKISMSNPQFQGFDLRDIQQGAQINYRFGWMDGLESLPVQEAVLIDYSVSFDGRSSIVELTGGDRSVQLNRSVRNRGYVGKKISEIVREIGRLNQIKVDVEETRGIYDLRQIWKPDLQFIKDVLLPKAISQNTGRGDYDIFIDPFGVLHFHPPRFSNEVYKQYDLNIGIGPFKEFKAYFKGETSNSLGGLSSRFNGYDPFEKRKLSFTATNNNTRQKDSLGTRSLLFSVPQTGDEGRFFHNGYPQNQQQVENEAKGAWYLAHRRRYIAYAKMEGDPTLLPGKVISIHISQRDGGYHIMSGRWLVERTVHIIDRGSYMTILNLSRGAILDGETEVFGVRRRNLQEETQGLREIQAEILA